MGNLILTRPHDELPDWAQEGISAAMDDTGAVVTRRRRRPYTDMDDYDEEAREDGV